jgi:hypothetical protein
MAKMQQIIPQRFKTALFQLLLAANPYATQKEEDPKQDQSVDCCICISPIGPFQALFIAPCSHGFHYKCIQHVLKESIMFQCPVCRQVANLDASVSMESVAEPILNMDSLRRSLSSIGLGDDMQIDQTIIIDTNVRQQQFVFELEQACQRDGRAEPSSMDEIPTSAATRTSMEIPSTVKMEIDDVPQNRQEQEQNQM